MCLLRSGCIWLPFTRIFLRILVINHLFFFHVITRCMDQRVHFKILTCFTTLLHLVHFESIRRPTTYFTMLLKLLLVKQSKKVPISIYTVSIRWRSINEFYFFLYIRIFLNMSSLPFLGLQVVVHLFVWHYIGNMGVSPDDKSLISLPINYVSYYTHLEFYK